MRAVTRFISTMARIMAVSSMIWGMRDSYWRQGRKVLGLIAAAWKEVMLADGTRMKAVYAGDYKVRPDVRGSGIAIGIFGRGLWALLKT